MTLKNAQLYEMTLDMKNYLESIHQSITNSILTLDNDYRVVTANLSATNLFQQNSEPILKVVLVFEDISREKRMKSTLTRYMAKDIVEKVLDDPERQTLVGICTGEVLSGNIGSEKRFDALSPGEV